MSFVVMIPSTNLALFALFFQRADGGRKCLYIRHHQLVLLDQILNKIYGNNVRTYPERVRALGSSELLCYVLANQSHFAC